MKYLAALDRKRWITAIVSLALAFLSGHIMQSEVSAAQARKVAVEIKPPTDPAPIRMALLQTPPVFPARVRETRAERKGSCAPGMEMVEIATGMVRLTLTAPCHIGRPVRLKLKDMTADVVTDARGRWEAQVPALAPMLTARFQFDGEVIQDRLEVAAAGNVQHVLLTWQGAQTFRIHVEPFDAAESETDGSLVRIGSGTGAVFEAFSFPASSRAGSGVVRLAVDATVTEENCGRTASVTAYQTGFSGRLRPTEISYTMPVCDRVGETVRLQNLFRDMRLAAR